MQETLPYEKEIERKFRELRKYCQDKSQDTMADQEQKSLRDYAMPQAVEIQSSILRPAIHATNFEIKPGTIQMIQNSVQFGSLPNDDPNEHLMSFLEICDTFKYNGVSDDAVRLRLFPFTLRDKAKSWLHSLPPGSITTWNDLAQKFLTKFFPHAKTAKMRNDITSFIQHDSESLYEAWERFKDLLRRCPHHGIPKWLLVQTFYNGLFSSIRTSIDAAAGGALMAKNFDEAYDLLETMAANNYQWPSARMTQPRTVGRLDNDIFTSLAAQLETLTKKIESLEVQKVQNVSVVCDLCAGNHLVNQCPISLESVQYIGNYNQQQGINNLSYYHQGVRNSPNQSWTNNQAQSYAPRQSYSQGFQNQPPSQQVRGSNLEELLSKVLEENTLLRKSQEVAIRNLEIQMGQLANAINSRPQGALPSDTEVNPRRDGKEQCNAVTLRSGKEIPEAVLGDIKSSHPDMKDDCEAGVEKNKHEVKEKAENLVVNMKQTQIIPPVPFPQRLQKSKLDKQFSKFLEIFKKLHINIPFADALEQMPSYVKFMKKILSNKKKLDDFETVALTEECSAILQKKLPPKLKDPGSFTIPCTIGSQFFGKALCDLGASINLMPLSVYKKLGLNEAKPTNVTLQLADRSVTYPRGIVEDVLVKVDKFIFPADFIVLDYEEDKDIPIILGRPFLATGRTLIDVQKGELTMQVQDEKVTFKVLKEIKLPCESEECFQVDLVEGVGMNKKNKKSKKKGLFQWKKKKDELKFGGDLQSQGKAKRIIKTWLPRQIIIQNFDPG